MKILIIPSWYGNEEKPLRGSFFKEQAVALKKCGIDVRVIFPDVKRFNLKEIKSLLGTTYVISNEDGIMTYRCECFYYFNRFFLLSKIKIFADKTMIMCNKLLQENWKPDIIHAHSCRVAGYAALKLSKHYDIPVVLTEHWSSLLSGRVPKKRIKLFRNVFINSDRIIAVSESLKNKIKEYYYRDIDVIPNMVNCDVFINKEIKIKKNNEYKLLSVGSLIPRKGFDILLEAIHKIKDKQIKLTIIGDGAEKERLQAQINELNISDKVTLFGRAERIEIAKQMKECDVFVLASRNETFGVVYIEALACGKPVIGTNCGGPEDIIDKDNGLLVPVNNVEMLASAIEEIIKNYHKYNAQSIRKKCIENFSEQTVTNKIINLYSEILNNRRSNYD